MVPPTEPCALRSSHPLKVSTMDFSWSKGGRCVWLTTYHPCSAETSRKSGALTYPEPLGPPRPVAGDLYFLFFYFAIGCRSCTNSRSNLIVLGKVLKSRCIGTCICCQSRAHVCLLCKYIPSEQSSCSLLGVLGSASGVLVFANREKESFRSHASPRVTEPWIGRWQRMSHSLGKTQDIAFTRSVFCQTPEEKE